MSMNRHDERHPRFWRRDRDWRQEQDDEQSFRREDYGFREDHESGRTAGDSDQQPFSNNPYGYYPGQNRYQRESRDARDRDERWRRDSGSRSRGSPRYGSPAYGSQRYGQREPYNAGGSDGRGRRDAPWGEQGSRYSESQYGGGGRRSRFDAYGSGNEPEFGEGPFADTSESPSYFGSGYYGDGGTSYTGGYDQRSRSRYPGSLGEDTMTHRGGEPRRYRTGPKGYTRSDERIREDISERLMLADSIDSSEVTVSVKDGRVTLEGTVPTRSMKHAIEDLADYTAGVQDVDNRIRVERAGSAASESTRASEGARSTTSSSSSGVQTASGVTPTSGGGSTRTTKQ
jgi:hypothetical protein